MTPIEAKQFLIDEFTKYIAVGSVIPGNLDELFNDQVCVELDEAVHDLCGEDAAEENNNRDVEGLDGEQAEEEDDAAYDDHGKTASQINNDGLDSQLEFLAKNMGDDDLKETLRDAIHVAFTPDEFLDHVE